MKLKIDSMWTQFWDMHSGGGQKEKFAMCYIEAPEEEAKVIFYNRFGHNPERVTCTCCGDDYSISSEESLEQLTAYHRNCRYAYFKNGEEISRHEGWIVGEGFAKGVTAMYIEEPDADYKQYKTLAEYLTQPDVMVIYTKEIRPEEKIGEIPQQGYVWVD